MTAIPLPDVPAEGSVDERLRAKRWQLAIKRAMDVVLASALLVVASPVLLVAVILIRLDSRGPAIFVQARWGWRERQFRFYKLRTMYVGPVRGDAESRDGTLRKLEHDPRVTRVGRLLRRTSIDELPQLWNVVRGDMSLVGPRPLVPHMLDPFPALRAVRCKVRPGITGLWQVNDREHNTHVGQMARWDLEYIGNVGVLLDARILARTVWAVASGAGAV